VGGLNYKDKQHSIAANVLLPFKVSCDVHSANILNAVSLLNNYQTDANEAEGAHDKVNRLELTEGH